MYKAILIFLFLGFFFQSQGQNTSQKPINTWVSIGANFPVGAEFNEVHSIGLNTNIYVGLIRFKNIDIGPAVNFNYHMKYLNEAAKNRLINAGFGLNANYSFPLDKSTFYLGVVGYYEGLEDQISPRKDFNGENLKVLSGSGFSFGPKLSLSYEKFVFQLGYIMRSYKPEFSREITSPFMAFNQLYEVFLINENANIDLSSISLSIAYEL